MRIKSVINGRDPEVLDSLFSFYSRPAGPVVDLTCNTKKMWKGLNKTDVVFCDIDDQVIPDIVCSYDDTPFESNSISVIVYDPPHLPSAAGTKTSLQHFVKNYGLDKSVIGDNISSIFVPFLNEANRILKKDGLIFAKLADFVHNHKYSWTLVDFVNAVNSIDGLTPCDLIIKCDPCAGNLKSGKWKKAHHARRSHCWWVIVRKGKCESSQEYEPSLIGTKGKVS